MDKWFVLGPEGPIGPVTNDQLRRGLALGKVPPDAVVAPDGSPAWTPVGEMLAEIERKERAVIAVPPEPPSSRVSRPAPPRPAPRPPPSKKSNDAAMAPEPDRPPPSLLPPVLVPNPPDTDPRPVSDASLIPLAPGPQERGSRRSGRVSARTSVPATDPDFFDTPLPPRRGEEPPAPRRGEESPLPRVRPSLPPAPAPALASARVAGAVSLDGRYANATLSCAVAMVLLLGLIAYRAWVPRTVDRPELAAEAGAILQTHEGLRRAARCETVLGQLDELARGKPYVVEYTSVPDVCRAVSHGRVGSVLHGGFVLPPGGECGRLETTLPRDIARHEQALQAVTAVTCGADRRPTLAADDAAKLAARAALDTLLPRLVRNAETAAHPDGFRACYEGSVAAGASSAGERARLRCGVLRSHSGKPVPPATRLQLSGLSSAFEAHRDEHLGVVVALRAQDRESELVQGFLAAAEARACAFGAATGAAEKLGESSRALAICAGVPD